MSGIAVPHQLILASAGAGKTYQISSRLIGLLAAGEEPDHILAATFTRKATGQILDRVLARLAAAALDPAAARELAAAARLSRDQILPGEPHFWASVLERSVDALHRFAIDTLDAFFVRAASAFEAELDLPPGWRIPSLPEERELMSAALLEVLARGDRRERVELLRRASRGDARRSVHDHLLRSIGELLEVQEQLDPAAEDPWGSFGRGRGEPVPTKAEAARLAAAVRALPNPTTQAGTPRVRWKRDLERLPPLLEARQWEAIVASGLCKALAEGNDTFDGTPIEGEVLDCMEEVLEMTRRGLRARLGDQVAALGGLTSDFRTFYRAMQRSRGLFNFGDITRLIGGDDPLADRSDLYYRLDSRIRHLLLDEFQDTSLAQAEALAPLIDEALSDDGRAVTIVADPKQSIYGWRGADPEVVRRIGERYSLAPEHLTKSYRSSQLVLDFVNDVFTDLARNPAGTNQASFEQTAARWMEDFQSHTAARAELRGHVTIEVGPADEGGGARKPRLFEHTAARVAELAAAHPGRSIGILTRTNAAVAHLFFELRKLGLAVSQEGGNPLTDAAPCEAVLALLRLVDHPGDPVARYHLAESPLGASLGFVDHRDEARAVELASTFRRRLMSDGYGRTLSRLAARIAPACDAREARRLAQLSEQAYAFDRDASLRPMDFVRRIEETRVEDPASTGIRVMTVHKAKGLEFDIVVLPELDRSVVEGGRGTAVLPYRAGSVGRVSAVLPPGSAQVRCLFPELEAAYQQRRSEVIRDGLSSLYVALTRAVHATHLIIAPDGEKGPGNAFTPARLVREAIFRDRTPLPPAVAGEVLYSMGDPHWSSGDGVSDAPQTAEQVAAGAEPICLREGSRDRLLRRRSPSQLHGDASVEVRDLLRLEAGHLDRGTLVHAWFESVGWIEEFDLDDESLLAIGREATPGASDEVLVGALGEFRTWLTLPEIRAALSRERYDGEVALEREYRFLQRRDGVLIEGVIDRLVIGYRDGRPVRAEIIDFKTDRMGEGRAPLERLTDHYAGQLRAYARAVAEMYDLPVEQCTAALVFVDAERVVPVAGLAR